MNQNKQNWTKMNQKKHQNYCKQVRVLSYLLPAMLLSVALNIPKFLEARLDTHEWIDERWKKIKVKSKNQGKGKTLPEAQRTQALLL